MSTASIGTSLSNVLALSAVTFTEPLSISWKFFRMSTIVQLGRILDGAILSIFVMMVSGLALHSFGAFHAFITITQKSQLGFFSLMMSRAFPFKNDKFEFNLMHIIMFGVLVALMSMAHHRRIERKERKEEKDAADKKPKQN